MGELYAQDKNTQPGARQKWGNHLGNSPEKKVFSPEHPVVMREKELQRILVRHSAAKLHDRLQKRLNGFAPLINAIGLFRISDKYAQPGAITSDENNVFSTLMQVYAAFTKIHDIRRASTARLDKHQVSLLCEYLTYASVIFTPLREQDTIIRQCLRKLPSYCIVFAARTEP